MSIHLTKDKAIEVNELYKQELENLHKANVMSLKLASDGGVCVGIMHVCDIDGIRTLIKELETLQAVIQYSTGIVL